MHFVRWLAVGLLSSALVACGSTPKVPELPLPDGASADGASKEGGLLNGLGSIAGKALEVVGLKKPEAEQDESKVPLAQLPDRRIRWRVHASSSLNVTESGDSLAVVTRYYQLKSPEAFLNAPAAVFGNPDTEREALGDDLVSVREVMLVPGRQHDVFERVPRNIGYVGVVALFRQPANGRWRHAFDATRAELSGINLGVHACALSVQQGRPLDLSADEARRVTVRCPAMPYRPLDHQEN